MFNLLKKEISSFLNSLIAYVVIGVFLTILGLFMWVFPNDLSSNNFNILEAGYANIDSLFILGPWVFLFLIPAITMRSIADEKRGGTIELLLTKPVTDLNILLAKYFAGMTLVVFSLIPTLLYYLTVHLLGNPVGNIDTGGMWGSYIGLLFLASSFVSIGIFASSLSENQIISFIVAVFLCFFCYIGFNSISSFALFGKIDDIILKLGIQDHYVSMSRGVIDTRDLIYFLSINTLFILLSKTVLESRKW
jgi:ABC-2 type transport system permease protein